MPRATDSEPAASGCHPVLIDSHASVAGRGHLWRRRTPAGDDQQPGGEPVRKLRKRRRRRCISRPVPLHSLRHFAVLPLYAAPVCLLRLAPLRSHTRPFATRTDPIREVQVDDFGDGTGVKSHRSDRKTLQFALSRSPLATTHAPFPFTLTGSAFPEFQLSRPWASSFARVWACRRVTRLKSSSLRRRVTPTA